MPLYSNYDNNRIISDPTSQHIEPYRSEFWKDYARLIHSAAFRRLQGKTQLYPSHENDYFRNRLTHSIEVAQIAKTIALKLNFEHSLKIDTDLIEFAALAHDIGHPPFGHQGEEALDNCMLNYGGFEGNAQTLRILTRLEKKHSIKEVYDASNNDLRVGLNLTFRSIAAILKYDNIIPIDDVGRLCYSRSLGEDSIHPVKGYYHSEKEIVEFVKENVLYEYQNKNEFSDKFKTIECRIMDISDDIAYSTYDLDDTLKANFHNPLDFAFADDEIVKRITLKVSDIFNRKVDHSEVKEVLYRIFSNVIHQYSSEVKSSATPDQLDSLIRYALDISYRAAKNLSKDGALRNSFTSNLIKRFISGIEFIPHEYQPLSTVRIKDEIKFEVEVLKRFNYEVNILSSRLKIPAFRGKQIVNEIFNILKDTSLHGYMLMPDDYRYIYTNCQTETDRYRTICDFIAGMTDKYCIEFYGRLTSENAETIFKPI